MSVGSGGLVRRCSTRDEGCAAHMNASVRPAVARALLDGPTGPRVLGLGRLDQMKHVLSAAVGPPTEPEVDDGVGERFTASSSRSEGPEFSGMIIGCRPGRPSTRPRRREEPCGAQSRILILRLISSVNVVTRRGSSADTIGLHPERSSIPDPTAATHCPHQSFAVTRRDHCYDRLDRQTQCYGQTGR
jgi:hypothetical protein